MKTKVVTIRIPLALASALERESERKNVTLVDVIRGALSKHMSSDKDNIENSLNSIEAQIKALRVSQQQIIDKLDEFATE